MKKNECFLIFGNWTSRIGNVIFDYINSVAIVGAFAKKSWVLALYQSSDSIINILFNIVGGAIADSGNRKIIIILADFISAIICFGASFFVSGNDAMMAIAIILANAILALVHAFSSPCFKAVIREMVMKERIGKYNSINNAGIELIKMLGPAMSVVVIKLIGVRGALVIDAVTFFISAVAECFLKEIYISSSSDDVKIENNKLIQDISDGFKYILKEKLIFYNVAVAAVINLFLAGYNLLLPYTNVILKDTFDDFYSKAMIMEAVGSIIGATINTKLPAKLTGNIKFIMFCNLGMGLFFLFIPWGCKTGNIFLAVLPFGASIGFLTIFNINQMTYIQVHVDKDYIGRVFSIIFTVAVLFMPIGSFLFSSIGITKSIYGFLIPGLGIIISTIIALFLLVKIQ